MSTTLQVDRRSGLGASDVAAAVGLSPWKSPMRLWQEKTGRVKDAPPSFRMRAGSVLEPLVLEAYEERTGRKVVSRQSVERRPDAPWLWATLDGLSDVARVVEAKTAGTSIGWGEEGTADVPDHYAVQVQVQMWCADATAADIPVLFNLSDFRVFTVDRDDEAISAILHRAREFWGCVETDTPPHWGKLDAQALAILNPRCEGDAAWSPEDAELVARMVDRYERLCEEVKALEEERETGKAIILEALGNASRGELPDGRVVRRHLVNVAERVVSYTAQPYTRHYFTVKNGTKR